MTGLAPVRCQYKPKAMEVAMPSKAIITVSWFSIFGFEKYEINKYTTQIRRAAPGTGTYVGRVLTPHPDKDGYLRYSLSDISGKFKNVHLHQLMLYTFKGPKPTPKHEGAHCDGNNRNNKLSNLKWKTTTENQRDRFIHGTDNRGERGSKAVLTNEQVLFIREAFKADDWSGLAVGLSRRFGVDKSAIYKILHRITWRNI